MQPLRRIAAHGFITHGFRTHRQDRDTVQRFTRALRVEIEAAHGRHFIAPPLDPRRRSHAEPIDVEDPTANAVLRDFGDGGDTRITHRIEPLRRIREPAFFFTDFDHEPRLLECRRHGSALGARARRGDQHSDAAAQQRLQGFDPLARQLVMRLFGAQRLSLRIERRAVWSKQRLEVRKPALAVRRRWRHDHEHSLRQLARQRCYEDSGARARQTSGADAAAGGRQAVDERSRRGKLAESVEEKIERHQRVRVATPNSVNASNKASPNNSPLISARLVPENPSEANAESFNTSARSAPPSAAMATDALAGVRSDSRGSGPKTVAPTVSAPRNRNSTRGAPSAMVTSTSPRTSRLTRASTKGTNPGAAGRAVQAVSSRLPSSTRLPERISHGSPFTVASVSPAPPPSRRYRRVTCTPSMIDTCGATMGPGDPERPQCQDTPRDASPRFACPTSAGSEGGCRMPRVPVGDSPPVITTSRPVPSATRCASRNTARAAATNPPASGVAVTRAGVATRHAKRRRSSARSSSGSSAASPTHHPGASDCAGSDTVTTEPSRGVARPRAAISPRSRSPRSPPIRIVTGTGSVVAAPAVEPASSTTAAPSVTCTAAMPRFGTARPGSSASTRTPRGTSARPVITAVR